MQREEEGQAGKKRSNRGREEGSHGNSIRCMNQAGTKKGGGGETVFGQGEYEERRYGNPVFKTTKFI